MGNDQPLGGDDAWVAFLAHLFGEAKRWGVAGLPPAGNLKIRLQAFENQIVQNSNDSQVNTLKDMSRTPLDSS
ncbi:hypothetical protein [Undibacterium sp. Ji42W]|uniref:hypothetical protein n=1 Tax=Undibacterium sp. Ji42W TaxID=3413039 RepID=UPI003BF52C79